MMVKRFVGACLVAWAILAVLSGCSKKEEKLDLGTMQGPLYKNKYFKLTVKIPPTWHVQDNETKKKLMAQGSNIASGGNQKLRDDLDASALDSVNLLTVFQYPAGTSAGYNPVFVLMADKVSQFPGVNRGSDYLRSAKALMERSKMSISFVDGVSSTALGGTSFDTMAVEIKTPKLIVTQKYFATIKKGYALIAILSYATDKELQDLTGIVQSITFQ